MKSLTQYLNEGLIADIILKVVDASLGWIGSSAKFIADNLVSATGELWETTKNIGAKGWESITTHYNDTSGRTVKTPSDEKSLGNLLNSELYNVPEYKDRKSNMENLLKAAYDAHKAGDIKRDDYLQLEARIIAINLILTEASENASDSEKQDMAEFVKKKLKTNKYLQKEIDKQREIIKKKKEEKKKKQEEANGKKPADDKNKNKK